MNFTYDFANGTTEIVYHPEKKRIPDPEMVEKINRCVYLLNIKVRPGNEGAFAYDIKGKTNFLAWQSEASEKARHEMEGQIADGLNGCMSMGIPSESVVQEKRYMYVDDRTQRIKFICIPGMEDKPAKAAKKNQENIYELETPLLPDTIPEPRSEDIYESFGNNSMNQTDEKYVEIKSLEEEKEEYREYVPADRPLYEEISTDTAEQIGEVPERKEESEKSAQSENSELYQENEEEEENGTVLLSDFEDDEDEKTVLLIPQPDGKAYLENIKTKEKFYIRKNNVKIGKKKEKVDIWIKENPTVSREHCVITYKMGCYYIRDCESLNHTYVNDRQMEKEEECMLENNSIVRLSNEEFVFKTGEE